MEQCGREPHMGQVARSRVADVRFGLGSVWHESGMERARDGAANGLALDQLITGSGWHESGLQRMLSACTAARLWCMRPGASCFDPIVSVHTGWAGPAAGRDGRGAAAAAEPWVRVSVGFRPGRGRFGGRYVKLGSHSARSMSSGGFGMHLRATGHWRVCVFSCKSSQVKSSQVVCA